MTMSEAGRGIELIPAPGLGREVTGMFTTRRGGSSLAPYRGANVGAGVGDDPHAVASNRSALARALRAPVTWSRAVHGADVGRVGPAGRVEHAGEELDPAAPPVDALVTTEPGRGLAVLAADCVPVLLAGYEESGRPVVVGAVHSGRRGVAAGAAPALALAMLDLGAVRLRAVVGPAICGRCYEVPAELRAEVADQVPTAWAQTSWGTPSLDLPRAVAAQLGALGVAVTDLGLCTRETDWLFSHRGDGLTGRAAGAVVLSDTPVSHRVHRP